MCQAAERRLKKAQELERSFQTPEGCDAALCWLNAEERKITCVGTLLLRVSPAIKTATSSLFILTVLLRNQSDIICISAVHQPASPKTNNRHTSQMILSEGLNVSNKNSSKNSCRQNAAFLDRICPGNSLVGVKTSQERDVDFINPNYLQTCLCVMCFCHVCLCFCDDHRSRPVCLCKNTCFAAMFLIDQEPVL